MVLLGILSMDGEVHSSKSLLALHDLIFSLLLRIGDSRWPLWSAARTYTALPSSAVHNQSGNAIYRKSDAPFPFPSSPPLGLALFPLYAPSDTGKKASSAEPTSPGASTRALEPIERHNCVHGVVSADSAPPCLLDMVIQVLAIALETRPMDATPW